MIYMLLACGFEEIEAITPLDILRRAGADVQTVAVDGNGLVVEGAHGIRVEADIRLDELRVEDCGTLILPGGSRGTETLSSTLLVRQIIQSAYDKGAYIAAICAAPTVLADMGLLQKRRATCYPSLAGELIKNGAKYKSDKVVLDGQFITSAGAGTAAAFGFALTDKLFGRSDTDKLLISMVY